MKRLGDTGTLSAAETAIASAATTDLGTSRNRNVAITGTTTITSFGSVPSREALIRFAGALTLTYDAAKLILPGAVNLVTAAGDTAIATSDASGNWTVRHYQRASGAALTGPYVVAESVGAVGYRKWSDGLIEQWGTTNLTLDGSGIGTITLPLAFPNNQYAPMVCNGDHTSGSTASWPFNVLSPASTGGSYPLGTIKFLVGNNASTAVRVNWQTRGN